MSELHSIPLTCKEGVYSVFDFYQDADGEDAIFFDYDTQYQMLTYDIPVGQDWREMTLYSVPEKDIFPLPLSVITSTPASDWMQPFGCVL